MKSSVSITGAESEVMKVLWQRSRMATEDIIAALDPTEKWHASTVKTLLARLLKKGAIRAQVDGRRFLYSSVMKREQWLTDESTGLLDRLFGGRVAPLVAHFSQRKKLSKKDVAELKQLINEMEDEQ
jgi:BlaI family transcriptional regulator, penicillinase repressor